MLHEMEAIVKKDELQQYNGKEEKPRKGSRICTCWLVSWNRLNTCPLF
jgi:hypothetical protein